MDTKDMVRLSSLTRLSVTLLLSLVTTVSVSGVTSAQASIRFNSPSLGAPGNREAGASRSAPCAASDRGLVALLPETNLGLTTQAYPTFFAYLPPTTATTAEFILYHEGTDELVYSTSFEITGDSGIASIQLPEQAGQMPLEVGESYYWYFTIVCNPADRSADMTVQGGIQRVAPDSNLLSQVEAAQPQEIPVIYAAAGIWHEALSTLVDLNRANPNDPTVSADLDELLGSVGLEAIANEPLF
ncbi:MAG: DUF928 domain-containing protein [Leptolyngbyaceae cyanobacterium SL_5_9]|nr:DUF928 domain-containing protein [Leptolyngbyaceae cyanobacterium SL_5_9]